MICIDYTVRECYNPIIFHEKEIIFSMFCKNLKTLRKSKNLTQTQLAKILNLSTSAISMYEQGRRKPDSDILCKICSIFKVSVDNLLGELCLEREVNDVVDEIAQTLKNQDGLMFNGTPMTKEEREKVAHAIEIAVAVTMSNNKTSPK